MTPKVPIEGHLEAERAKLLFAELERVYRTAPVGLCMLDRELKFVRINQLLAKIHGLAAEDHIGKDLGEVLPDIVAEIEPIYREVLESGNSILNLEVSRPDIRSPRDQRCYLVSYHALAVDAGNVLGVGTVVQEITDRKLASRGLRKREQLLSLAERNARLGSWQLDVISGAVEWSDEIFRIFDVPKLTEPSFEAFLQCVHPGDRAMARDRLADRLASNVTRDEFEYRVVRRDGQIRNILAIASFVRDELGRPLSVYGTAQDITEWRKTERALRESEANLASILDTATDIVMSLDLDGTILYINHVVPGLKREQVIGSSGFQYLQPEGCESFRRAMEQVRKTQAAYQYEIEATGPHGSTAWYLCRLGPVLGGDEVVGYTLLTSDISERRKAEASLRESERLFRGIFEQAAVGVALIDTNTGRFVRVNNKYLSLMGYQAEELQARTFMELTYPDDLHEDLQCMRRLHAGEISEFSMEKRLIRRDQTVLWCNLTVSATWNPGDKPVHHIAIVEDISRRKEAERMLKLTKHSIDTSPVPIFWVGSSGRFQYVNRAAAESLGYDIDELRTMGVADIDLTWPAAEWATRWEAVKEAGSTIFESVHRRKDGTTFPVDITGNYFAYLEQESVFCLAIDTTERKRHQESTREHERVLAHVARLSTMGEMVAGIAHEINQPLSAISGLAEACSRGIAAAEYEFEMPLGDWSRQIGEQALRCGEIISRLRSFVKRNEKDRGHVDLNQAIRDSISLVASDALKQSVRVCRDLGEGSFFVRGNEVQLQQVIVNLLRNAYEAVGDSDCPDRRVIVRSRSSPDSVHVVVEDHGPGVEADVCDMLFDAFFTTKPDGLGMGLAISRSIVESHGGRLRLESIEPHGAGFHIELPSIENPIPDV